MKFLYCYKKTEHIDNQKTQADSDVRVFVPKIRQLLLSGEARSAKAAISRLLFQRTSRGKAKIYYLNDGDELMHTSYVVPKCSKFPFLGTNDYEIGPCYTYPAHRGKGIYPKMLQWICNCVGNDDTVFYMIVDESNIASIKGIEKAGLKRCGTGEVSKFTKQYRLV